MKCLNQKTERSRCDRRFLRVFTLLSPKAIFILFFGLFSIGASAQGGGQTLLDTNNVFVRSLALEVDSLGDIFWTCDSLQPGDLFLLHKAHTGLSADDSMHYSDTAWQDSLSLLWHQAYTQYYKGVKVEFSTYSEHYNSSGVLATNGWIIEGLNMSVEPTVSEHDALEVAFDYFDAELYRWQPYIPLDSIQIGDDTTMLPNDGPDSSSFPVGELVLYNSSYDNAPNHYVLCWKFTILATKPWISEDIYIDANTAAIVDTQDLFHPFDDATHWQYGTVPMDFKRRSSNHKYYLWADDGRDIRTRELRVGSKNEENWTTLHGVVYWNDFVEKTNHWGTNNRSFTSSHYVFTEAWNTFVSNFGHHGSNANNRQLRVLVFDAADPNTGYDASGDGGDYIQVTKKNGYLQCSYDVAGHEYTHAIIHNTRALVVAPEAAAINEGYADIFGVVAERYSQPGSWDWTMFEDVGGVTRDLENPTTTASGFNGNTYFPDEWGGTYYYSGPDDNFGSHQNSAVIGKCFYLLSQGGTIHSKTVTGIGIDKAQQIAFYAMRNLSDHLETFPLAREHWLHAAAVLFGRCSQEYFETCRAWRAVGVGTVCEECNIAKPGWDQPCHMGPPAPMQMGVGNAQGYVGQILVFPNPTSDFVYVSFVELTNANRLPGTITIKTMEGKEAQSSVSFDQEADIVKLDVSNLASGVYFIVINTENNVYSQKLIIP